MKVRVSEIIIKDRIRENIGDLTRLKESMKENGLINPISITKHHELVAGFRRLQSAKELGWEYIDCFVIKSDSQIQQLQIEADENLTRKDFTVEEIIKLNDKKRYLSAGLFEKMKLLLKKIVSYIKMFIQKLFKKGE